LKAPLLHHCFRFIVCCLLLCSCAGCFFTGVTEIRPSKETSGKNNKPELLLPPYISNFSLAQGDVIKIEAVSSLYKGANFRLDANNSIRISMSYDNGPYRIIAGDYLRVVFALDAAPPFEAMVRPDGKITLPGIGEIVASGSTTEALSAKITEAYSKVVMSPHCTVSLQGMNNTPIEDVKGDYTILPDGIVYLPVLGRFKASGRTPDELGKDIADAALKRYGTRFVVSVVPQDVTSRWQSAFERQVMISASGDVVLPVLGSLKLGGLTLEAAREVIRTRYQQFSANPVEINLTLLSSTHRTIYVSGQVRQPGPFPLTPGMTTLKAVMAAGGVGAEGSLDEVVIIHRDEAGDVTIYKTNLSEVIGKNAARQDIVLAPQDIVFVPKTSVAQANQFIDQYINRMLPFTRNISYSYNQNMNPATQ